MSRTETVRWVDDLTGGQAEETLEFAVDGSRYEIDLSSDNAAKLREALAGYIHAGRRSQTASASAPRRGRRTGASSPMSAERRQHNNAIRAWARQHGYKVSERGRISGTVVNAYERDAGGAGTPSPRPTSSADVQFQAAPG